MATLAQMCARSGMRVHSYVLMSNHYHLLPEDAEGESGGWDEMVSRDVHAAIQCASPALRASLPGSLQPSGARQPACISPKGARGNAIPVQAEAGGYFCAASEYILLNPAR